MITNVLQPVIKGVLTGVLGGGGGVVPFDPSQIAGLAAWYDASADGTNGRPNTITQSGGKVSKWDDLSGNGNHATQGAGADQPTTGQQTIGGKNAIRFDGTDKLILTSEITYNSIDGYTVFAVCKPTAFGGSESGHVILGGAVGSAQIRIDDTPTKLQWVRTQQAIIQTLDQTLLTGTNYIFGGKINSSDSLLFTNTTKSNVSTNPVFTSGFNMIGGLNSSAFDDFIGDVGEIIVYKSQLSFEKMNEIGDYLSNKWSITWSYIT